MSTYNNQLKKWASKEFDIDIHRIESVELIEDKIYGGYCDTCRYEDDAYLAIVRDYDGNILKNEKVRVFDGFTNFLKAIIDA